MFPLFPVFLGKKTVKSGQKLFDKKRSSAIPRTTGCDTCPKSSLAISAKQIIRSEYYLVVSTYVHKKKKKWGKIIKSTWYNVAACVVVL